MCDKDYLKIKKGKKYDGPVVQKDLFVVFTHYFRICDDMSQFNDSAFKGKVLLTQGSRTILKHSSSMKTAAAKKLTTKYKKLYQMLQPVRKKKKNLV